MIASSQIFEIGPCNGLWANLKSCVVSMAKETLEHFVGEEKLAGKDLSKGRAEFQTGLDASSHHGRIASAPLPDDGHHITVGKVHFDFLVKVGKSQKQF